VKKIIFVFSVIIVGIIAVGGWFYFQQSTQIEWKMYVNDTHNFQIQYPEAWVIREDQGDGFFRLDIFYPEDIENADIYGNVAVLFTTEGNPEESFNTEYEIMQRDLTLNIQESSIGRLDGFQGVAHEEALGAESIFVHGLYLDRQKQGIFQINGWAVELASGDKKYQTAVQNIISSIQFPE